MMYYKIPIRFQREVMLHVMKNTQDHLLVEGTSSILGIFGPPGEGKTVMCKQILQDVGAFIEIMSVGEFENENAGKPAELLKEKYNKAKRHLLECDRNISVLIIDDADAAFGNWGNDVQYTVNTQMIVGELMQIATNEKIRKVPIILTGNDFSKIYYPLRRSGRMSNYYWNPNDEERLEAVNMLFDWLSEEECLNIINFSEHTAMLEGLVRPPISFYSSIKGKLVDDGLWEQIYEKRKKSYSISYIKKLILPDYSSSTFDNIINLCKQELKRIKESNVTYAGGVIYGTNTELDTNKHKD